MAHIHYHITFIGGQPDPVVQGVLLSKPDCILFMYSTETEDSLKSIKKRISDKIGRELPSRDFLCTTYEYYEINEKCNEMLNIIKSEHKISINLSGGAKPWNEIMLKLYMENRQKENNQDSIYFIHQNGNVLPIIGNVERPFVDFDFEYVINQFKSKTPFTEYSENEKEMAHFIHKYYDTTLSIAIKDFISSCCDGEYKKFDKKSSCRYGIISWSAQTQSFKIKIGNDTHTLSGEFAPSFLLNTGWFEYIVANQMAEIYGANNVWCNCEIIFSGNKKINEVDVIVNAGNKPIFVECKTQIKNSTDLDKFRTVCEAYGGLSAKRLFITRQTMGEDIKTKCKSFNIYTYITCTKENKKFIDKSVNELKQHIDSFINTSNT